MQRRDYRRGYNTVVFKKSWTSVPEQLHVWMDVGFSVGRLSFKCLPVLFGRRSHPRPIASGRRYVFVIRGRGPLPVSASKNHGKFYVLSSVFSRWRLVPLPSTPTSCGTSALFLPGPKSTKVWLECTKQRWVDGFHSLVRLPFGDLRDHFLCVKWIQSCVIEMSS